MTEQPNSGATVVPAYAQDSKEVCIHEPTNPTSRKGTHAFRWVWQGGVMTTRIRCSTCGYERENK